MRTENKNGRESAALPTLRVDARRRALLLAVTFLFSAFALCLIFTGEPAAANAGGSAAVRSTARTSKAKAFTPPQDYSKFSHSSPGEHAALTGRFGCSSCHDRRGNSAEPSFPGHRSCISCHQTQFTTPNSPLCTICHTPSGLGQQNPPLKNFPGLRSFDARFDHAQHTAGAAEARGASGCATCHGPLRRDVAKTIPAGLGAHTTCYQCHAPGKSSGGRDISSCGVCHTPGRFAPTSTTARSYAIGFTHADHGPRQRLSCEACHTVGQRGLSQGRQVTSTFPAQHFPTTRAQSCASCHNNQRSFGEANFNDCKRCHTGTSFRL